MDGVLFGDFDLFLFSFVCNKLYIFISLLFVHFPIFYSKFINNFFNKLYPRSDKDNDDRFNIVFDENVVISNKM